jgi:hypothetical protein
VSCLDRLKCWTNAYRLAICPGAVYSPECAHATRRFRGIVTTFEVFRSCEGSFWSLQEARIALSWLDTKVGIVSYQILCGLVRADPQMGTYLSTKSGYITGQWYACINDQAYTPVWRVYHSYLLAAHREPNDTEYF